MFYPFVHLLSRIYSDVGVCDVIRLDSTSTAMYDVFTINMNMIKFKSVSEFQDSYIYALHVLYVLLISIILMNLIIAVYSDTVSQLARHRSVISHLQRLSIVLLIERRVSILMYPYYFLMLKLSSYQVENNKIYIIDVVKNYYDS